MTGDAASATVSRRIWMDSASSRSRCVSDRTVAIPSAGRALTSRPRAAAPGRRGSSGFLDLRLGLGLGLALRLGRLARAMLDRFDQRLQALAIFGPALDRAGIDRLAHLGDASGLHRAVGLVELQALVVPRQAQE